MTQTRIHSYLMTRILERQLGTHLIDTLQWRDNDGPTKSYSKDIHRGPNLVTVFFFHERDGLTGYFDKVYRVWVPMDLLDTNFSCFCFRRLYQNEERFKQSFDYLSLRGLYLGHKCNKEIKLMKKKKNFWKIYQRVIAPKNLLCKE